MTGHRVPRRRASQGIQASRLAEKSRFDWVDAAKGLCIILVVMFHSTLGVEKDIGVQTWMHTVIEWAKPFRMPDFFLISGLFLAARINRPWRDFLDAKVLHFAYFYVLWFHIHFGLRLKGIVSEAGAGGALRQYLEAYIDPFGSLWFIYLLAVFCIVTKFVHRQPVWLITSVGLVAHVLAPHTNVFLVDEFFSRFVFFYLGYAFSDYVLAYAFHIGRLPLILIGSALGLWGIVNTLGMMTGLAAVPVFELAFAALGIAAVIAFSVAITRQAPGSDAAAQPGTRFGAALAYCGRNSIVIYLAFTIFMALTRTILLKAGAAYGIGLDGGLVALAAAIAGLSGALIMHFAVVGSRFEFLFVRPAFFRLGEAPKPMLSPRAIRR